MSTEIEINNERQQKQVIDVYVHLFHQKVSLKDFIPRTYF